MTVRVSQHHCRQALYLSLGCGILGSHHPSPNVKTICNISLKFGQKLSHHVMPKVLVLKALERHVMSYFGAFFGQNLAGKYHIMRWMLPAEIPPSVTRNRLKKSLI